MFDGDQDQGAAFCPFQYIFKQFVSSYLFILNKPLNNFSLFLVSFITNVFGYVQPTAFIFAPLAGILMDKQQSSIQSKNKNNCFAFRFLKRSY